MCSRDKELLKRALNGDIKAFEELVSSNQKRIYNLCLRMMKNDEDAQDMAQEVLIKAWRNLKKFTFRSSLSTWLYKIAVNTCLDELRRRKNNVSSIEDLGEKGYTIKDEKVGDIATSSALRQDIKEALNHLQDKERLIIILKDVQGYSYEEIGQILRCPVGTVRSRLSRSRKKLAGICIDMELYDDSVRQNTYKEVQS